MLDFSHRSTDMELMDNPENFSDETMAETYRQINFINKYLLGDYFILREIASLTRRLKLKKIILLDLGCGNGDLLIKTQGYLQKFGIQLIGIGFDPYLKTTGSSANPLPGIHLFQDWNELIDKHTPHISTTSLTLHHLYGAELDVALKRLIYTPTHGFVISDLVRSKAAYHIIQVLTCLFSRNKLIRHDAPLSVHRAFSRTDMLAMKRIGDTVATCKLSSNIAFRWLLTGIKSV